MRNIILIGTALLIILSSLAYADATSHQKHSFVESTHSFLSQDNRTVSFLVVYSENSTGSLAPIPDGNCTISFSDNPATQGKMVFTQDTGYGFTNTFSQPGKIIYNVSCSHSLNAYPPQSQVKSIDLYIDYTEVLLIEPKAQITKRDVTFTCEARGTKPIKIHLYTDTSGEWKLRSSIEIRPGKSPYRVKFTENDVADGTYNWNCEAETGQGNISASKIQTFSVKFSPNCNEGADCAQWQPDLCPQSGKQTRSCNKTRDCSYQTSKQCAYNIPESNTTSTEQPIQTLGPDEGVNKKTGGKQEGGSNILLVFLIIIIMAGGAFAFIKIRSKKKPKKEEDIFGEDEFEEEEPEERSDEGEEK